MKRQASFAHGLVLVLLLALSGPARAESAAVFMYHRFAEDQFPATSVRIEAFRAQLELLQAEGFEIIGLPKVVSWLRGEGTLPERSVVITIDDAYASIYNEAWPVLQELGVPFTIFVATGPVDQSFSDYLSWDQLREMAEAGVSIANHGADHLHLATPQTGEDTQQRSARVRADLLHGQARLHEMLGARGAVIENVFAYPFGEYDTVSAAVVRELGWLAFGQQSGAIGMLSDPLALPRYPINERYSDLTEFRTKANSLPLAVERLSPWDPVTSARPVLQLWLSPSEARLDQLACFISGQGRIEPQWLEPGRHLSISPPQPLKQGRSRVNCTAPGPDGRYYWFSHQWLVP